MAIKDSRPDSIVLRPVKDRAVVTLSYIEVALGMFLATTLADDLDAGQRQMVTEAMKRIEQVASELEV